jgi:hypothetical protein
MPNWNYEGVYVYMDEVSPPTNVRYNHVMVFLTFANHAFAQSTAWGKLHEPYHDGSGPGRDV